MVGEAAGWARNEVTTPASARRAGVSRVSFDRQRAQQFPVRYILADVVSTAVSSHHDPDKLARVVMKRIWHQR